MLFFQRIKFGLFFFLDVQKRNDFKLTFESLLLVIDVKEKEKLYTKRPRTWDLNIFEGSRYDLDRMAD